MKAEAAMADGTFTEYNFTQRITGISSKNNRVPRPVLNIQAISMCLRRFSCGDSLGLVPCCEFIPISAREISIVLKFSTVSMFGRIHTEIMSAKT